MAREDSWECVWKRAYSLPGGLSYGSGGPALSEGRWDRYRAEMSEAGVTSVCRHDLTNAPVSFWLRVSSKGLAATRGSLKGFVFFEAAPAPLVNSLDNAPGGAGTWYKSLGAGWYLFFRQS